MQIIHKNDVVVLNMNNTTSLWPETETALNSRVHNIIMMTLTRLSAVKISLRLETNLIESVMHVQRAEK